MSYPIIAYLLFINIHNKQLNTNKYVFYALMGLLMANTVLFVIDRKMYPALTRKNRKFLYLLTLLMWIVAILYMEWIQ